MVPPSSVQLIDEALSATGPESLSYIHESLKWLIREHLLSLLDHFPTLSPYVETFTHEDGTAARLLNVNGLLPVSPSAPPVLLTIWLCERYPFAPPVVYVFPTPSPQNILRDGPFITPSGAIASQYLDAWQYPRSDLSHLAHDLAKNLGLWRQYSLSDMRTQERNDSSLGFKREAIDKLLTRLQHDKARFRGRVEEDIESLTSLQALLVDRANVISSLLLNHEKEQTSLKHALKKKREDADVHADWLLVHGFKSVPLFDMEAFEAGDEKSRRWIESKAAELAIDDAVDALGKALEEGAIDFGAYLKQVRGSAREQFFHTALVIEPKDSHGQRLEEGVGLPMGIL